MQKKLLILLSVILVMITTFAYSALSTSLAITSEVKFRPLADIRINGISLSGTDGATIQYESEYSKNTISSGFILPTSSASISYTVHIDNSGDVDYSIYDILNTSSNNPGLVVSVSGYNIRDVIPAKTSLDLVVTYTTTSPSASVINVVNTMDFKRVFYVSYNTGTSQTIPQQIKYEGVGLTLTSTTPTKTGYTFSKWNTKQDGTGVNYNSGATYIVDEDKILYAKYNLTTYNITYELDGGTNGNNPSTYTIESSDITLADATKENYVFKGWTGNGTTTPTKNLVLPTGSTGNKTFTANFADETNPTIEVTSTDGNTNYLNSAHNINAGYNTSTAAITFKINAQDAASGIDTIEYAITTTTTVPTTGWTTASNGNISQSKGRGTYYIHVRATDLEGNTTTVTAKATTIRFRVTYYDDYSSSTSASQNQYYTGTTLTSRTPTAKSGYTFDGWYSDTALTNKVVNAATSYTPTTSIRLYGKWNLDTYTISYAMNNGINNSNNPASYTVQSSDITLASPTKTLTFKGNYNATAGANAASGSGVVIGSDTTQAQTFAGWTGSNGSTAQTSVTITSGSTGNKNYEAHWTATSGTVPTVTREGYTCGWNTSNSGTTIEYSSGDTFPTTAITEGMSATVNLYAVCIPNTYNISYTMNGGTSGSSAPTTATYDQTVTITKPTKTFTVNINANNQNATIKNAGGTVVTSASSTQTFAGWTADNNLNTTTAMYGSSSSSITSNWSNGSTKVGATPATMYFKNLRTESGTVGLTANWTPVDVTLPNITKTGYTCGYATSSTGAIVYNSGDSYTPSATTNSTTLFAKCNANTYNISYTLNGGNNPTTKPATGTYDADVVISNPTKTVTVTGDANGTGANVGSATSSAQTFAGWSSSTIGSNAQTGSTTSNYAAWNGTGKTKNTYFKNLKETGTVTMVANWTPVDVALPTLSKTGYVCKWYTESTGGTEITGNYTPAANSNQAVTIYARCSEADDTAYTVNHYVHNLGSNTYTLDSTDDLTGRTNATLTLANLKKTIAGFTYVDGYLTGDTTKPTSGAVTTTTILADGSRVINLYYRRNYLYVRYDMNGGSLASSHSSSIGYTGSLITSTSNTVSTDFLRGVYGSRVGGVTLDTYAIDTSGLHNYNSSSGINIKKTGYAAKSSAQWNSAADGTGTNYSQTASTINANGFAGADLSTGDQVVTIYVNWVPTNYTITYAMNNGINNSNNPAKYTIESNDITLVAPTKTLTFKGNYNATAGANAASGSGVVIGSDTTQAQTFAGWTGSNGNTPQTSVTIASGSAENKNYEAHWTAVAGTLPTVTKTGYTCGWSTSSDGTTIEYESGGTFPTSAITEDMSATVNLYAVCNPKNYTLTINPQNGTYNSSTSNSTKTMTYDATTNNDIGIPTRDGYTFDGWYLAADNKTSQMYDNTGKNKLLSGYWDAAYSTGKWVHDGDATIYAHWSKNVENLDNSVSPTSYIYDGTTKTPTPIIKDSSTTLTNGTDYTATFANNKNVGTATATITGSDVYNQTTKAYYTGTATVNYAINNAKLTFNKGTCSTGAATLYTRKDATVVYTGIRNSTEGSIPTASKSGYTFDGWYTANSGGSKVLNADGSFTGNGVTNYTNATSWQTVADQTLYARCTRENYTISYAMNNGLNNSNNPTSYNVESSAITLVAPTKILTFKGNYNATAGANASSTSGVVIGSDTTQAQTFKGWTGSNGSTAQTSVTIATGSTGNKNYEAHWTAVEGTVPTVTKTGYTCGWNTSNTGTTIEIASGGSFATSRITEGMSVTVNLYAVCIDDIAPTIVSATPSSTLDLRNYIDFNATDAGSGVIGYNITTTNTQPTTWIPVVSTVETTTETKYEYDAAWARVFHHNNHWGSVLFANAAAAQSSNELDRYSVLENIADYKNSTNWEFLLQYPGIDASKYNRWTQTSNPVTTSNSVSNYSAVHADWTSGWFGLAKSTSTSNTFIDGQSGSGWWYAIGSYSRYYDGIPGPSSQVGSAGTVNLWSRIDNLTTTTTDDLARRVGDIKEDGTYYLWVKDAAGNTSSQQVTISYVDTTKPTATITSTNNVAASQTVTITLDDEKALDKYSWGTNNPASTNLSYTTISNSPTSSEISKTVSTNGTYYISVVDKAGNKYYTSKAFYKTTLNANGGSVSPASVVTMNGNSFALPSPTKTGYTFDNWYTDAELTTPVTLTSGKYKPTGNVTLYAKWTINNPQTPTITGGATKVYGASATTLTCTENTTYASGTSKYYSFGYASSDGGTPGNWTTASTTNTLDISATEYVGQRWYSCRVYASDGTITSETVTSSAASDTEMTINNATLTFNKGTCSSVSGTATLYAKKGTTGVLTTIRGTTAGTIPTGTPATGYTFQGWYSGDTKVINADKTIVASVSNWTDSSKNWLITSDQTLTAKCDDVEDPTATITGGTTLKQTSQSVTIKCSDTAGVTAYYWGTSNPALADITDTTSLSTVTGAGLSKTGLTNGTYYLGCRDAAGNFDTTSITINKYQVQNVLEKMAGTRGTYKSANYETTGSASTYYVKSGTSLTLASIYTAPTGAGASGTFLGYTTAAPSTTAATLSNTAPTASGDTTIYYMWWNRNTYTVTVTKHANGSTTAATNTQTGNNVTVAAGASNNGSLTVKYGDTVTATATPSTGYHFDSWSGYITGSNNPETGATISSDQTITPSFTGNTYTATFNYYDGTQLATITDQCTVTSGSSCTVSVPTEVSTSTGQYGGTYVNVSRSTSNLTAGSLTMTADASFYAYYSSPVTIYYPIATVDSTTGALSNSSIGSYSYYRNEFYSSATAMTAVINSTQTATTNFTFTSSVDGYGFYGFRKAANSATRTHNTVALAATSSEPEFYAMVRKGITATVYYNSGSGNGTLTVATATTATAYRIAYCGSTTAMKMSNANFAIPAAVSASVGQYGNKFLSLAQATSSMATNRRTSTSSTSAGADTKVLYAMYQGNDVEGTKTDVTNYYYDGSAYTSRTLYRNSYFTSVSGNGAMTTVLSDSATGTSNYTTAVGPGSSVWTGLSTAQDTTVEYATVADAAISSDLTLYTVYTMNIAYEKGTNTNAIGKTSDSCKITTSDTACNVTLPSITPNTGYNVVGWSATKDSTTGTAAGQTYSNSSNTTKLYGNVVAKTYTLTINPQGGTYSGSTNNATKEMTYNATTNNDIGTPTRTGYTFNGWYTAANGGTQVYGSNGRNVNASTYWTAAYSTGKWKYDGNLTVYAHWSKDVSSLTNSVSPESYIYSGSANSPTPTVKDGSTALTSGTDYTVSYTNNTNVGTATATITGANVYNSTTKAYYTGTATVNYAINNAKLTFNKGTCSSVSGTATLYTKKDATKVYTAIQGTTEGTIPTGTPATGYTFQGWYNSSSGGSKVLNANGSFTGSAVTNYTDATSWQTVADQTLYARCADVDDPTATITGGTTLKQTSQSVTIKCSDTAGVTAYYWGTSNPALADITDTTSLSTVTGAGLSKTGLTNGTYYLGCRDAAGNFDTTSITINKYQVQNVLEKIAGTRGTYKSANYETTGSASTYYVKSGTSLTLASIYTAPTGAGTSGTFLGYTTSAPSTTAQTPSNTAPTAPANDTTVYYMWWNRNTYTVTITKHANGGTTATTNGQTGNTETVAAGASNNGSLTVKYGDTVTATATPSTGYHLDSWSGYVTGSTNPATGATISSNQTITPSFTGNTYTATFKYYDGTQLATTTSQCTVTSGSSCTVEVPTEVSTSTGQYESTYVNLSRSTSNLTAGSLTMTEDATFYAYYSSPVTIYYPIATVDSTTGALSNTSVGSYSYYRNEFYNSASAMTAVINTTQTATTNFTFTSSVDGYSLRGFANAVNSTTRNYASVAALALSTKTTSHAIIRKGLTATVYYNSGSGNGTLTVATATTATAYRTMYCGTTTTIKMSNANYAIPAAVSASVGQYGNKFYELAQATSSMAVNRRTSTTSTATGADTKYLYAIYQGNDVEGTKTDVTNYYYDGSAYASRTLYRNSYFTSVSGNGAMSTVLATAASGTANYTTAVGPGSSVWTGLSTAQDTTTEYSTVADAAISSDLTLYTIYTFNVDYQMGTGVSGIGANSGSCKVTTSDTSCDVNLPSITASTGHTSVGWNTTSGASTGTAAGQSYTISTNTTTLYANATADTHTVTYNCTQHGGSNTSGTTYTATVNYGDAIDLTKACTPPSGFTHYTVSGSIKAWNTDSSASTTAGLSSLTMGTADVTLYAKYKSSAQYTGTFTVQDTAAVSAPSQATTTVSCYRYNNGSSCSINAPTLTANSGYTASGWKLNGTAASTTADVASGASISLNGNKSYASVTKQNTAVSVAFNKNTASSISTPSGCSASGNTVTCTCTRWNGQGCSITSPSITAPTGKHGVGFNTSSSATTSTWNVSTAKTLTANATYHAITAYNTYSIAFNRNCPSGSTGSGTMSNQSMTYGTAANLTANAYKCSGYIFDKWTTSANGTGTAYTDGQSVNNLTTTNNGTYTIYAQWKQVWAENLAYNNSNTGVACSDAQCMIDKLWELLNP